MSTTRPLYQQPWLRPALAVVVLGTVWLVAWSTGVLDQVDVQTIRTTVAAAGAWGILIFLAGSVVANLLQLPGMLFIVAAIVAFGDVTGAVVGWAGATLAASTTFWTARAIGGVALDRVRNPLALRLLGGLERRPTWTVAVLRTFMQNSPILNAGLGLTPIPFRRYLLGTAVGLWVPVLAAAWFTAWFL